MKGVNSHLSTVMKGEEEREGGKKEGKKAGRLYLRYLAQALLKYKDAE